MITIFYKLCNILLKIIAYFFFVLPEFVKAKLRGRSSFIRSVIDGGLLHNNNNYAIFLIFQKNDIEWSVLNALETLKRSKVNVLIVSNTSVSDKNLDLLKGFSRNLIFRDNVGYDFGGYKDGSLFLIENGFEVDKLIYLNDSGYFYKKGLDELFDNLLDNSYSAISAFENWEYYYHLQSFCFSVDKDIFNSKSFRKFWVDYLPVSSRVWAIKYGEVGLSKVILKNSNNIKVIFSASELNKKLQEQSQCELMATRRFLPVRVRLDKSIFDAGAKDVLLDEILEAGFLYSQIHTLGFYHIRFNNSPLMKKDLIYRMQYSPREFEANLISSGALENIESVMMDVRRKGAGTHLRGVKKFKWRFGIE